MGSDLEANVEASGAEAGELVDRQRLRIAELEERLDELAVVQRRLLESEQLLAELPDLRRRSDRLEELESSPLVRVAAQARGRARAGADASTRSISDQVKRLIARILERITAA